MIITCKETPIQIDPRGLGVLLFEKMKEKYDEVAQIDALNGDEHTYAELLKHCIRIAEYINKFELTRNDVIAIYCSNRLDACVPFLASVFLGIPVCPLDISINYAESLHYLLILQPRLIFCEENKVDQIVQALNNLQIECNIIVFGTSEKYSNYFDIINCVCKEHCSCNVDDFEPVSVDDVFSTAIILFTSGTTSSPKAVCCTHYGLMAVQMMFKEGHCFCVSLILSSLYWISGVILLIVNILCGTTRLICNKCDPQLIFELVKRYQVSYMWIAPTVVNLLVQNSVINMYDTTSVKSISIAGGTVPKDMILKLRDRFYNAVVIYSYGMTENCGPILNFNPKRDKKFIDLKINSVGLPMAGCNYKVVDLQSKEILGPNQMGEIRVRNPYHMRCYYKNPECTQQAFDEDGFLCTGDIGYFDTDFCFYVESRINDVIVYRHWQLIPIELDAILLKHPEVFEAAVIGIPHSVDREHLRAIVVLKPGSNVKKSELLKFYNDRVQDHQKLRGGLKIVDSLPHTSTGKLRRTEIKNQEIKQSCKCPVNDVN